MDLVPGFGDRPICVVTHPSTLLPFHDNFIEIRGLSSGKLKQITEGDGIKMLASVANHSDHNIKFLLGNPQTPERRLALGLVANLFT